LKKILYLSFYFEPDLSAGSFRNSTLAKELAVQFGSVNEIIIITTQPNRYSTFKIVAPAFEQIGNITIHRIKLPEHKNGFLDQIYSFKTYFIGAKKIYKNIQFDLVFVSTGRLFTAFLASRAAKSLKVPFYIDVRDIFTDTIKDVIKNPIIKSLMLPILRFIEKMTFENANHINLISEGFKPYFQKYPRPTYSYFTNGIDDVFINKTLSPNTNNRIFKIVYAGNIGEGQGLHTILPKAAKALENRFEFLVIGDGGAKGILEDELKKLSVNNVKLISPVKRSELMPIYDQCDFFFIHLNDYDAFKKVLPSKIFELAAYDKPIIAGVSGYAAEFVSKNVSNIVLFESGDTESFVNKLNSYLYKREERTDFRTKFKRSAINKEMASSILQYI
jgi:glycosyltransferase involved in cell wall biosynthesis